MSFFKTCILLAVWFNELPKEIEANIVTIERNYPMNELNWFITREMWQAKKYDNTKMNDAYLPSRLVVVAHTVSLKCNTLSACAAAMRRFQGDIDIPYNFVIGNDGRVYEGRGWNTVGAHSYGYNSCTIGLAFVGDYREDQVTILQQMRAQMLLAQGVKLGYLHSGYHVLGHCDIRPTLSPGDNLYNAIRKWPGYDHENRYKNRTCSQIHGLSMA